MQVWFGTTTAQWNDYKKYYFAIRDYLRDDLGCIMAHEWIDDADRFYQTPNTKRNVNKIYQEVVEAIQNSQAVVIEYTVPNFSSSHQINFALLQKKPTLVMRLKKDNPRFADSYLEALQSPYLTLRDYTKDTYKEVLEEFIGLSRLEPGLGRYNIVLDAKQKHYLDWASSQTKRSRSDMIRELINEKMMGDREYKKYKKFG